MSFRVLGPDTEDLREFAALSMRHSLMLTYMAQIFDHPDSEWLLGDLVQLSRDYPDGITEARRAVRAVVRAAKASGAMPYTHAEKRAMAACEPERVADVIHVRPGRS